MQRRDPKSCLKVLEEKEVWRLLKSRNNKGLHMTTSEDKNKLLGLIATMIYMHVLKRPANFTELLRSVYTNGTRAMIFCSRFVADVLGENAVRLGVSNQVAISVKRRASV
jgi:hypothetical protein